MGDCIFCKIVNGSIPSYKIYENESVLAFLDIAGDAFGHTLVIPKKHYENIIDIPQKELEEVIDAVKIICEHYKKIGYTGVNILNSSGIDAQQSVFHLHFHIIPRSKNDGINAWPKFEKKEMDFQKVADLLKIN